MIKVSVMYPNGADSTFDVIYTSTLTFLWFFGSSGLR